MDLCYDNFTGHVHQGQGPISQTQLQKLKRLRQKEKDMYALLKEIMIYAFLLVIVWSISYGNRDSNSYGITYLLENSMLQDIPKSSQKEGFRYVNNVVFVKNKRLFTKPHARILGA